MPSTKEPPTYGLGLADDLAGGAVRHNIAFQCPHIVLRLASADFGCLAQSSLKTLARADDRAISLYQTETPRQERVSGAPAFAVLLGRRGGWLVGPARQIRFLGTHGRASIVALVDCHLEHLRDRA